MAWTLGLNVVSSFGNDVPACNSPMFFRSELNIVSLHKIREHDPRMRLGVKFEYAFSCLQKDQNEAKPDAGICAAGARASAQARRLCGRRTKITRKSTLHLLRWWKRCDRYDYYVFHYFRRMFWKWHTYCLELDLNGDFLEIHLKIANFFQAKTAFLFSKMPCGYYDINSNTFQTAPFSTHLPIIVF